MLHGVLDDADHLPSVVAAGLFDGARVVLTWIARFAGLAPVAQIARKTLDGRFELLCVANTATT